jgi:TnpA family transposase
MPIGFLTTTERDRLNRFPAQIPAEDLRVFFLLSDADQTAINKQREAHTRLGFAMQLCALRYLGFAPDDLSTAPWEAVVYVAQQLAASPDALATYGRRIPTRTLHLQHVQAHLGFRSATPLDMYALHMWLVDRALERIFSPNPKR